MNIYCCCLHNVNKLVEMKNENRDLIKVNKYANFEYERKFRHKLCPRVSNPPRRCTHPPTRWSNCPQVLYILTLTGSSNIPHCKIANPQILWGVKRAPPPPSSFSVSAPVINVILWAS